jgi:hypothetical protein
MLRRTVEIRCAKEAVVLMRFRGAISRWRS